MAEDQTPFDLSSLDTYTEAAKGVPMPLIDLRNGNPIYNPDDGSAVTITLLGRNSEEYRAVMRSVQKRRVERQQRGVQPSEDDIRADDFEVIVACTKGWTIRMLDGQPFPFSVENARRLWSDRRFQWLFERASMFIADDANFLATARPGSTGGPSATSS